MLSPAAKAAAPQWRGDNDGGVLEEGKLAGWLAGASFSPPLAPLLRNRRP